MRLPDFLLATDETGILVIMSVAVAGLTALALCFAVVALARRTWHAIRGKQLARKQQLWEDQLLECASGYETPAKLHALVTDRDLKPFLRFVVPYVLVVSGSYRDRLVQLVQPYIPSVLPHVAHRDPMMRAQAVHLLSLFGSNTFGVHLLSALRDSSPIVAMAAARGLAHADANYGREILAVVHRFDGWGPHFVASILTSLGSKATLALVDHIADEGRSVRSRVAAAEALRWLGAVDAVPAAVRLLSAPCDREVAAAALRLLRQVGWDEQAPVVRRLCHSDDFVVRLHAISALAQLGNREDAALLIDAVSDSSRWVAIRAARGLYELGALDELRQAAAGSGPAALLAQQVLTQTSS